MSWAKAASVLPLHLAETWDRIIHSHNATRGQLNNGPPHLPAPCWGYNDGRTTPPA